MSYSIKVNGRSHKVSVLPNGESVYDPPLPDGEEQVMANRFQEIAETRTCPGLRTETSFWAGRPTLDEQFRGDPVYCDFICQNARKRGYNPKPTDFYFQSLARPEFRDGDPEAFVSAAEGVNKIKKILEKRGLAHDDGIIKVKPRTEEYVDPLKNCKPLADDIVNRFEQHYRSTDDKCAKMSKPEIREMIIDKHAPKHDIID